MENININNNETVPVIMWSNYTISNFIFPSPSNELLLNFYNSNTQPTQLQKREAVVTTPTSSAVLLQAQETASVSSFTMVRKKPPPSPHRRPHTAKTCYSGLRRPPTSTAKSKSEAENGDVLSNCKDSLQSSLKMFSGKVWKPLTSSVPDMMSEESERTTRTCRRSRPSTARTFNSNNQPEVLQQRKARPRSVPVGKYRELPKEISQTYEKLLPFDAMLSKSNLDYLNLGSEESKNIKIETELSVPEQNMFNRSEEEQIMQSKLEQNDNKNEIDTTSTTSEMSIKSDMRPSTPKYMNLRQRYRPNSSSCSAMGKRNQINRRQSYCSEDSSNQNSDDEDSDTPKKKMPNLRLRPDPDPSFELPSTYANPNDIDFNAKLVTDLPKYEFNYPLPATIQKTNLRALAENDKDWRTIFSENIFAEGDNMPVLLDRLLFMERLQIDTEKQEGFRYQTLRRANMERSERLASMARTGRIASAKRNRNCCKGCLQIACAGDCPLKRVSPKVCIECRQPLCVDFSCRRRRYDLQARLELSNAKNSDQESTKNNRKASKPCQPCTNKPKQFAVQQANQTVMGRPSTCMPTFSSSLQARSQTDMRRKATAIELPIAKQFSLQFWDLSLQPTAYQPQKLFRPSTGRNTFFMSKSAKSMRRESLSSRPYSAKI